MLDFGWKNKAERLRMTILSAGHQPAKEMPVGIFKILDLFRRVAQTGDGSTLQEEMNRIEPDVETPLWEPIEIHGWKIKATMYLQDGQLWWLVHASRRSERSPSEKDIVFLDKILDHLGAQPKRHMIIGPTSSPPGEPALPFGWWTWLNREPLYEVQVNKGKKGLEMMRIVPLGTRPSDGYKFVDLSADDEEAKP